MTRLFHISGWRKLASAAVGDEFLLLPGQQQVEGEGVYFAEGRIPTPTTAEGARGGVAAVVVIEADGAAGWWRTKPALAQRFGRPRTWHTDRKPIACRVLEVGSAEVAGRTVPVLRCAWAFAAKPTTVAPRHNPPKPIANTNFRRWFNGSQVVDADGNPKVLYHGTRSPTDFEVFRTGTIIEDDADEIDVQGSGDPGAYLGPHFAEEPRVASAFALGRAAAWDRSRHVRHGSAGGRVIPVVASLRKVLYFDSEAAMLRWIVEHGESRLVEEEIYAMGEEGDLEVDEDGDVPEDVYASYDVRMAALKRLQGIDADEGNPGEDAAEELGSSARDALLARGFDGVKYRNEIEGGTGWVALVPGTVKSALGNNGNWDRSDPSIVR